MREYFLLDPGITFLNHGSFGATPRPVFDAYQAFQRRLEMEPVRFLQREYPGLLIDAREKLARFLGAAPDDLVLVPNATFALNTFLASLELGAGDEVLTTNQEYGACMNAWQSYRNRRSFDLSFAHIPLPLPSDETVIDLLWRQVTERTRVIFISHVCSSTGYIMPVAELGRRAASAGIRLVVDGAHAPGHIPVDLSSLGVDVYFGTCHKWLCSPKGVGFLYVRESRAQKNPPLVVGWAWNKASRSSASALADDHAWLGTHDPSGYLTIPQVLSFQEQHPWSALRDQCHQHLAQFVRALQSEVGRPPLYHSDRQFAQMAVVEIPVSESPDGVQDWLLDSRSIEVPVLRHQCRTLIRVSYQVYNTPEELEVLVDAIRELLLRRESNS